jgi:glycerol kinase
MDPMAILQSAQDCIASVMKKSKVSPSDVLAVGIINQRETTIVWDRRTGKPLYGAVVWLDTRTKETQEMLVKQHGGDKDALRPVCGLPISSYFSGVKLRWLFDHVDGLHDKALRGEVMFGTVDTWLLWTLTGGIRGGVHATDVTNASRTMLMHIEKLQWDEGACKVLGVPTTILPEIRSSAEVYGHMSAGPLTGVPIAGIVGDQQAALVGQGCFSEGEAKNTYGTGSFMLVNTGTTPKPSHHGLLTTAAYKLGPDAPAHYALEGAAAVAGVGLRWAVEKAHLAPNVVSLVKLAASVPSSEGVVFVPAFSGLLAPHWNEGARGLIVGLTHSSTNGHMARALFESLAFQVCVWGGGT